MNIYNRIIVGIKRYGLRCTIKVSIISLTDYLFDFRYGTDTVKQVELEDMDIQSDNRQRGERYALTPAMAFNKLMAVRNFPDNSVFVDLGCGKGKILMQAARYGFKRIVGIDFSNELCATARRNISLYKKKSEIKSDIEIINSDVIDYKLKGDENIFFLFNPFDEVVLSKVLRNITASIEKYPRDVYFVYYCPYHGNIIERERHFVSAENYILYGCEFAVYVYSA